MTVRSPVIQKFLAVNSDAPDAPLSDSLRVQILSSYADLRQAKVHQYAAFIISEMLLIVWDDDALHLETRASGIIADMTKMIWTQAMKAEKEPQEKQGDVESNESRVDVESGDAQLMQKRKTKLINSILVAMTLCLIVMVLGAGWRELAIECAVDFKFARLGLVLLTPVQIFFTLVCHFVVSFHALV